LTDALSATAPSLKFYCCDIFNTGAMCRLGGETQFFDATAFNNTRLGGGLVGGPLVLIIKGLWLRVVPMAYDPWPLGLAFLLGVIIGHHFSTVCPW
jgi:hypothetical protein